MTAAVAVFRRRRHGGGGADLCWRMQCRCGNGGVPVCFAEVWQFPWLFTVVCCAKMEVLLLHRERGRRWRCYAWRSGRGKKKMVRCRCSVTGTGAGAVSTLTAQLQWRFAWWPTVLQWWLAKHGVGGCSPSRFLVQMHDGSWFLVNFRHDERRSCSDDVRRSGCRWRTWWKLLGFPREEVSVEDDDVACPDWFTCICKDYAHVASFGWSTQLVEDCHMAPF